MIPQLYLNLERCCLLAGPNGNRYSLSSARFESDIGHSSYLGIETRRKDKRTLAYQDQTTKKTSIDDNLSTEIPKDELLPRHLSSWQINFLIFILFVTSTLVFVCVAGGDGIDKIVIYLSKYKRMRR